MRHPLASAAIISRLALAWRFSPIIDHHRRIALRVGSSNVFFLRPPPALRTRPGAAATLLRMSERP
jgi:hypothetical protein